jgi:hypothetical protein
MNMDCYDHYSKLSKRQSRQVNGLARVLVDFYSKIEQAGETTSFHKQAAGRVEQSGLITRIRYDEDGLIPVKMMLKADQLTILRGQQPHDYSLLRLQAGQSLPCSYTASGHTMDLVSQTESLAYDAGQLTASYSLLNGSVLVGRYELKLLFNAQPSMINED